MAKKYYKRNDEPPKEGWVKYGYKWISPEDAKKFIHPTDFNPEFQEICRMKKKGSPYTVVFQSDPMNDEGDLSYVMCSYVRKTGAVGHSHTLVAKDLGTWITCKMNMEKYGNPTWSEEFQDMDRNKELFNIECI